MQNFDPKNCDFFYSTCPQVALPSPVQKQLSNLSMTAMRCHVQSCQVVYCDVIDWSSTGKQDPGSLSVIALGRHV